MSQFPPSRKRLRQARARGQVAYSGLLGGALTLAAGLGALLWGAPRWWGGLSARTAALWAGGLTPQADQAAGVWLGWLWSGLWPLWSTLGLVALLVGLAQTQGLWSWRALAQRRGPAPRRLAPAALRLGLVALLLGGGGVLLAQALPSLGSLVWGTPQAALVALWPVLARLLGWVVACWLAVGALDRLYQGWAWRRGLRMTRAQVEAERRQEGAASATRRRRGAWRWGDGPLSAVHQASAVIAAPGAAVALAWAPGARRSPVVLARARGASASRLLGAARGRGVPVAHDAELALGLAALPAGAPVPPALFEPLAACFHSLGLGAQTP